MLLLLVVIIIVVVIVVVVFLVSLLLSLFLLLLLLLCRQNNNAIAVVDLSKEERRIPNPVVTFEQAFQRYRKFSGKRHFVLLNILWCQYADNCNAK